MTQIAYVYAIGRNLDPAVLHEVDGVDGGRAFHAASFGALTAIYSLVAAHQFSQSAIDARAADLDWLSTIGYSHQRVNEQLAESGTTIPLRAFTLFSSPDALLQYLRSESDRLAATLDRLEGKREWTIRVELDAEGWNAAVLRRVESLRKIAAEAESAPAGKAYLLKKKLEESKKKAAREAEESLVSELCSRLGAEVGGELIVETRQTRSGSFPQINLLLSGSDAEKLRILEPQLAREYSSDGVRLVLTGPWPAYSFAAERSR